MTFAFVCMFAMQWAGWSAIHDLNADIVWQAYTTFMYCDDYICLRSSSKEPPIITFTQTDMHKKSNYLTVWDVLWFYLVPWGEVLHKSNWSFSELLTLQNVVFWTTSQAVSVLKGAIPRQREHINSKLIHVGSFLDRFEGQRCRKSGLGG